MKKALYPVVGALVALFSVSCGSNTVPATVSRVTDTFHLCDRVVEKDTITKEDFDKVAFSGYAISRAGYDTSEARNILRDRSVVMRHDDRLTLNIKGNLIHLVNNSVDNSDSFAHYTYLGFNKDIGQYVVYGSFWEWDNYLLFDKETGDTTITIGYPVVSPDKKLFICCNSDLVAQFTFNGLELYENSHKPKLLCQRELSLWGPGEIKWTSNSRLLVKADVFVDTADKADTRTTYYRLKLQ